MGEATAIHRRYGNNVPLEVLRILFLREAAYYPVGSHAPHPTAHHVPSAKNSAEEAKEPSL